METPKKCSASLVYMDNTNVKKLSIYTHYTVKNKSDKASVIEDIKKGELPYPTVGSINWYSRFGK